MIIIGKQLVLRDWIEADLEPLRYWFQPDRAWKKFDAPYYPLEADEIPAYIERRRHAILGNVVLPEPRTGLAIADVQTNELLGAVTAYWESIETLWLSIGIIIYNDAHWGRGLGYEAMGLWTHYQFDARPDIARLDLRTWSGNYGMISVARKLGFMLEACFRKARIVDGEYYDSLGFGILREEWHERYPHGFGK